MADRRRIRRRDGARNWRLLRDLADPELWIDGMRPHVLDYVRHNGRITHNDAMIPERLRALHRGPAPPHVRRMIERPCSLAATHRPAETLIDPARVP